MLGLPTTKERIMLTLEQEKALSIIRKLDEAHHVMSELLTESPELDGPLCDTIAAAHNLAYGLNVPESYIDQATGH
jgi:hypothetical protein